MTNSARAFPLLVSMLAAGATSMFFSPGANPQATTIKPGSGEDLRAAYATPTDIAEGKKVAAASCAKCHGLDGVAPANAKGVPHIAGQRPAYLHIELRVYQTGARGENPMAGAVKYLSDDALMKVSAYYASLEPAPPANPRTVKAAPAKPDPLSAGKAAAAGCAGCHGQGGVSTTPGMPSLVGLDPKYLVASMNAYKSGNRKDDMMKTLLAAMSEADIANVALYYALQKPVRAKTPAPGDKEAGKAASAACAGCHGDSGVSGNPATPSLAGQDAQYFAAAMKAYKDGSRKDDTMKGPAVSVDENAVKNMAAFYASQQPQPPKVRKPLTTAEWAQRCDRCHGVDGNSTDPRSPALAGQRVDYLETVLRAYQKGTRKSPQMHAMTDGLTDADVANLAAHYARQKPRAFVYVVLPPKK
ncbi:MAG: c-type cytochrome [Betaproteobacteria bacterium]|nr:c-type cytochrome [Betaproteobacteria bacterium]